MTSRICYIQLRKTEKWVAARLIGLSFGDVLWISFSISQASQLSVLFRKIICPLLAVLILLLAIYKHLIPPTTGFFNCNDPTIWLPYKGDTFSTKVLISVVFLSFFVFVSIIINYTLGGGGVQEQGKGQRLMTTFGWQGWRFKSID